jgi:hypothetical protein
MSEKPTSARLSWDIPLPGNASLKIEYQGAVTAEDYKAFMERLNDAFPIILDTIFAAHAPRQIEERGTRDTATAEHTDASLTPLSAPQSSDSGEAK